MWDAKVNVMLEVEYLMFEVLYLLSVLIGVFLVLAIPLSAGGQQSLGNSHGGHELDCIGVLEYLHSGARGKRGGSLASVDEGVDGLVEFSMKVMFM